MKKIYSISLLLFTIIGFGQAGTPAPYYDGFNWAQDGTSLKSALANKITTTHTRILSYSQSENALKIIDLDPNDATNTNVLLIYGFSDEICNYTSESNFGTSPNGTEHRRRHKEADVSGPSACAWNREHVYPKSRGTPNLGTEGSGADAHHLRPADVQRNADRGSIKFAAGSGNSSTVAGGWYPGDEWKGDVARIIMYLYLRYPTQCKPINVGTGPTTAADPNMVNLFLQWNAEDPVSPFEDTRNTYLGNINNTYGQGNRNPFIDNPYLATLLWGGPPAENKWPDIAFLSNTTFDLLANVSVYPNPVNDNKINIQTEVVLDEIELISINGQIIQQIRKPAANGTNYTLENLPKGFYILKLSSENQSTIKKIIVN